MALPVLHHRSPSVCSALYAIVQDVNEGRRFDETTPLRQAALLANCREAGAAKEERWCTHCRLPAYDKRFGPTTAFLQSSVVRTTSIEISQTDPCWHLCDSARRQKIGWRTLKRANCATNVTRRPSRPVRVAARPAEETFSTWTMRWTPNRFCKTF